MGTPGSASCDILGHRLDFREPLGCGFKTTHFKLEVCKCVKKTTSFNNGTCTIPSSTRDT